MVDVSSEIVIDNPTDVAAAFAAVADSPVYDMVEMVPVDWKRRKH